MCNRECFLNKKQITSKTSVDHSLGLLKRNKAKITACVAKSSHILKTTICLLHLKGRPTNYKFLAEQDSNTELIVWIMETRHTLKSLDK